MWDLALEFAAVIGWCWSTAEHLAWKPSSSFSSLRSAYTTSILGGGFVVTRFRLLFVCLVIFSYFGFTSCHGDLLLVKVVYVVMVPVSNFLLRNYFTCTNFRSLGTVY